MIITFLFMPMMNDGRSVYFGKSRMMSPMSTEAIVFMCP
jgi:hypothetical protein